MAPNYKDFDSNIDHGIIPSIVRSVDLFLNLPQESSTSLSSSGHRQHQIRITPQEDGDCGYVSRRESSSDESRPPLIQRYRNPQHGSSLSSSGHQQHQIPTTLRENGGNMNRRESSSDESTPPLIELYRNPEHGSSSSSSGFEQHQIPTTPKKDLYSSFSGTRYELDQARLANREALLARSNRRERCSDESRPPLIELYRNPEHGSSSSSSGFEQHQIPTTPKKDLYSSFSRTRYEPDQGKLVDSSKLPARSNKTRKDLYINKAMNDFIRRGNGNILQQNYNIQKTDYVSEYMDNYSKLNLSKNKKNNNENLKLNSDFEMELNDLAAITFWNPTGVHHPNPFRRQDIITKSDNERHDNVQFR